MNIATQGYGVGNWYLYNGDEDRALEIFERIIEGTSWAAFGYIAAEAEVARMYWWFGLQIPESSHALPTQPL